MEDRDAAPGQVPTPATGPDTVGHPERSQPQAGTTDAPRFLTGAKAPADLLDRDPHPGLRSDAAQLHAGAPLPVDLAANR